jgi:hypothetical protein
MTGDRLAAARRLTTVPAGRMSTVCTAAGSVPAASRSAGGSAVRAGRMTGVAAAPRMESRGFAFGRRVAAPARLVASA